MTTSGTQGRVDAWGATGRGSPPSDRLRGLVVVVTLVLAGFMLVFGVWSLLWPSSFADFVDFPPYNEHFLHDVGAFQIGLGLMLLLALLWRDPLTVALGAFFAGNTIHAVNHAIDLDHGGKDSDPWVLGTLSVLALLALVQRVRQGGYTFGRVSSGPPSPALQGFVDQKTASLTTYRRNGTPVATPLSIAVDGDRAVIRSFEKAWKSWRIAHNPAVTASPCKTRGQITGPAIEGTARRLEGAESKQAARLLRRKYPLLHGVVVPLSHRLLRAKTGRTVHFELVPSDPSGSVSGSTSTSTSNATSA